MLTQSKEVQNAWRASQRTLDIKVTIDGKTYGATDINSLKYDSGAYNGDTFAIGSTYSNTVQIEFSHLVEGLKLGMEVRPSIGIKTSSGYVYEPLGVFIISSEIKMDRNNNLTTVSASDRFCGLEGGYVSKLTYPAKVLDVIAEICAQSGVKANTDDLARLPHQEDLPAPITGQSYRKALGWIAQLYVGYALFDRQGLFTIRTISEPNYELDPSQYEQAGLTKNEAAYKINGIQCQVTLTTKTRDGESTEETKTYQAGDATGSQIKLENNIMTPQRLNDIWEQLKDLTFYPFSLNWFGNPAVEAGDWLRLEDKQGNSFVVPNSSYTLDFNGGLSATSKADQTTSSDQMVPWQGSVAQTIKELQLRRAPDGTVVFPPSVTAPPTNAKFNDVWFKKNGNSTELWIFEKQDDGSGKWIRKDLSDDEIKKKVADAQQGLNQAKADIINNKQKADADIENLNKSIEDNKKATDQDIQNLNKSIEVNKKVADESLQKLNDSVTNLQGQYDNNVVPNLNKVMADASDALQKYIAAQNSIADLTKQAQEQGKDIADVTNTVKGLNINYANLAGGVNSTKVDVKGLQTTVGTANGDIARLKLDAQNLQTMLAGKVDNTTYTNFVNLTNQALNARLTASDLNGYAKTTDVQATANGLRVDLNSITDRMNNLKIGARNLLHNTSDQYRTLTNDGAWLQKTTASSSLTSVANYHDGDEFTYAATVTNTSNQSVLLEFQNCGQDRRWLTGKHSLPVPAGAKDYRIAVSMPITTDTWFLQTWLIFQGGKGAPGEKIQVKDERLVFGTISNTWSPNPEDVAQNITELSSRITANSQQFSSYYTKTEADNKTNSAKSDAINTIRNDRNWQGLSNILTNSGFLQTADGFMQKVQQTVNPIIDNLNIGTRNLLHNTSDQYRTLTGDGYLCQSTASNVVTSVANYHAGDSFTYAATITNNSTKNVTLETWLFNQNQQGLSNNEAGPYPIATHSQDVYPGESNKRVSTTFQISGATWYVRTYVIFDGGGAPANSQVQVKDERLVEGKLAGDWSPNPDDNQIAFSELSQSLDGLRSTVGSNYGNLQSQISQSSAAVRTELIDKVNGVQNQLTSTADSLNLKITNLKIGARNLLHNTSDQYRTLTNDGAWLQKTTASNALTSVANYHGGDEFTYAATVTNTSNQPVLLEFQNCGQDRRWLTGKHSLPVPAGAKDYRIAVSFPITADTRFIQAWLIFQGGKGAPGEKIQVKDERLVEGAYAGAWSSNPNDVAQNITEINATVQGLQSTVSNNYGSLQSQISQSSSTVRTELIDKLNGVQNQITTTANGLDAKIGAIQVGGRNLLIDTDLMSSQYWTAESVKAGYRNRRALGTNNACLHTQGSPWISFNYKQKVTFDTSKEYTFSVYVCSLLKNQSITLWLNPDNTYQNSFQNASITNISDDIDWHRLSVTFRPTRTEAYLSIGASNITTGQDVWLSSLKLEEGNIATDYTHAPEDTEKSFTEVNAAINGLRSTVSSNHNDLQSQISQTAKTIRQEVSDKTSGLQTQINQQANNFNVSLNSLRKETAWQKVTSAIDANNYKTTGNYWIQAAPNSNTPDSSAWAYLQVVAYPDVKRIKQTWQRDNNENEIYTRLLIGNNWTSWQRTVTGGNIMAQINMSAGTTLIQNDKIYMDSSSTIFSGKAFIPDAAITNISADKITAGTLDAGRINVINLNANNITAGTLRGSNGEFYLDSGALHVWQNNHDAWIDQNGIHDYDNQRSVWIQKGEINFEHQLGGSMKHTGVILTNSENSNLNGAITIKGDEGFLLSTKNFTTNYWSEQGFSWGTNTAHYVSGSGILGFNNNITVSAGSTDDHSIAALIAGAIPSKNLGNVFGARAQPGVYIYGRNDSNKDHSFVDIKAPASIHLTTLDSYITIGDTTGYERNSDVSINSGNYLTVSADNSINITACSKTKAGLMPRISLSEASTSISGDSITLNAKNYVTLLGSSVSVTGDFGVLGKKNAIVPTSRGMAAINAYETAEYYFGDIGETQTNSNGVVTVMIDPYFLETVNTLVPYQVFLTSYGDGNVWVSSRSANNFTVKSSNPNIHFAWEIKAKRKGYENDRMKIVKGVFNNEQY